MKILHVLGAKQVGGAELFFMRLLRQFAADARTVNHAAVRKNSWAAAQLQQDNIPHTTFHFGGRLDFRTTRQLRHLIEQEHPDIILGLMNRACRAIPQVAVPRIGRLGGFYDIKYYKHLDHLVGITPAICEHCIQQGWPAERMHFIPNFVETPPPNTTATKQAARQALNLPADAFICVMGGRLHPVKGVDTALQALAKLPQHIHGVFAGSGPAEAELKALAASLNLSDRAHWPGWLSPVTPAAHAADAWLMPSRHEPFGSSMLDAWAHNLPLIASDVDGPRHLLTHNENALIVPPDDPPALAEAIRLLAENPTQAQKLAANGLAAYTAGYSPAQIMQKYINLFESIRGGTPT